MRRPRTVRLVACVCACLSISACGARDRVNARCEWTGDSGAALDLSRAEDWQHLVVDAQLAEDLAIRYDDALEAHGIGGPMAARCRATLGAAIRARHGVTDADVQRARAHRNPAFDRAVLASFLVLFTIGGSLACRVVCRRYVDDPPVVRVAAAALTTLAAGALAVPLSSLWITTWELVRIGNDHLASRVAKMPAEPLAAIGVAAVLVFSLVALTSERQARRSDPVGHRGCDDTRSIC